jgi:uncharacterized protein (DUF1778 family)
MEASMCQSDCKHTDLGDLKVEVIELSSEAFDQFEKLVEENPLESNEALQNLLKREPRWS